MKARLLDLFCGAGGAAKGYQRAGFYVVGVDIEPQPRYAGDEFVQGDALTFLEQEVGSGAIHGEYGEGFDAIHAAPMWLQHAKTGNAHHLERPDDVTATAESLRSLGLPYVCESGTNGPLTDTVMICGAGCGLQIVRHMFFAANWPLLVPPCSHPRNGTVTGELVAYGAHSVSRARYGRAVPPRRTMGEWRSAAGLDWMTQREARLASPPAYTELIGHQLMTYLRNTEAAGLRERVEP